MSDERQERAADDQVPDNQLPESAADDQELRERCDTERETMSPRETADCAGSNLAELYDTEEDGGS